MGDEGGIEPVGDVGSSSGIGDVGGSTDIGAASAASPASAAEETASAAPPTDRVDTDPNAAREEEHGEGHGGVDALARGLKEPDSPGLSGGDRSNGPDRNDPNDPANAQRLEEIDGALKNGGQINYKNAAGQETPVSVTPSETHKTNGSAYDLRVQNSRGGTDFLHVEADKGQDPKQVIDRTLNAYTQLPEQARDYAKRVNVFDGANPADGQWRNTPGYSPDHVSAATGGGNTLNFYNGVNNLTPEVFNHEVGHSFGAANGPIVNDADGTPRVQKFPEGWGQAADRDGAFPSNYARDTVGARTNNYSEDFADSFDRYVRAMNGGTLGDFRQQFPGRAGILDTLMREQAAMR